MIIDQEHLSKKLWHQLSNLFTTVNGYPDTIARKQDICSDTRELLKKIRSAGTQSHALIRHWLLLFEINPEPENMHISELCLHLRSCTGIIYTSEEVPVTIDEPEKDGSALFPLEHTVESIAALVRSMGRMCSNESGIRVSFDINEQRINVRICVNTKKRINLDPDDNLWSDGHFLTPYLVEKTISSAQGELSCFCEEDCSGISLSFRSS